MIIPTVGRVVWFWKDLGQAQPYAAQIAFVHSSGLVNIGYLDRHGVAGNATSVPLIQDGESPPEHSYYCEWMPYQKGQAAKTEEVERSLLGNALPHVIQGGL